MAILNVADKPTLDKILEMLKLIKSRLGGSSKSTVSSITDNLEQAINKCGDNAMGIISIAEAAEISSGQGSGVVRITPSAKSSYTKIEEISVDNVKLFNTNNSNKALQIDAPIDIPYKINYYIRFSYHQGEPAKVIHLIN